MDITTHEAHTLIGNAIGRGAVTRSLAILNVKHRPTGELHTLLVHVEVVGRDDDAGTTYGVTPLARIVDPESAGADYEPIDNDLQPANPPSSVITVPSAERPKLILPQSCNQAAAAKTPTPTAPLELNYGG